jgi:hypothetical protein
MSRRHVATKGIAAGAAHGIARNRRSRDRKEIRFLTSGLTDPRRRSPGSGAALLTGVGTIPDINGLNADPCGDALPLHRVIAGRLKGKQGSSATPLAFPGIALLVVCRRLPR